MMRNVRTVAGVFCLLAAPAIAQTDDFLQSIDESLDAVAVARPGDAMCDSYRDGRYFQISNNFGDVSFSYDTKLQVVDERDDFIVTHVVIYALADEGDVGEAIVSFNTPGAVINPGLTFEPPFTGNLGIQFPSARQTGGARFRYAEFEPMTTFDFSTTLRLTLLDSTMAGRLSMRQAAVSIRGCLFRGSGE
jgi:hypothetical protein